MEVFLLSPKMKYINLGRDNKTNIKDFNDFSSYLSNINLHKNVKDILYNEHLYNHHQEINGNAHFIAQLVFV